MKNDRLPLAYCRAAHVALITVALVNGGCLWIAAGAAGGAAVGYAYYKGQVCGVYNACFADTWAATHAALGELGMRVVHEECDTASGFIESRTTDGDKVRIHLEVQPSKFPAEGEVTRVSVRIATFGDRPASERILDQLGVHLAPMNPYATQVVPPSVNLGVQQAGGSALPPPVPVPQETAPPPLLHP
jgi:hypothetical protein